MRPNIQAADEILNKYFPVLDHGFVSLVDYMGGDEAIEQAARVSYGAGTRKTSDTNNLLRYLLRQKHTSPFEQTELKFHMGLPIAVARQVIRHRTASVNEYSGRYSVIPSIFYTPDQEHLTTQSSNNKQGRTSNQLSDEEFNVFYGRIQEGRNKAVYLYKDMLNSDVAKELARLDLPLSTYTYWYWKIDLHNLFHFLRLRCDGHAQYETRAFANIMAGMAKRVAPLAFQAFVDYSLLSSNFTLLDKKMFNKLIEVAGEGVEGKVAMGEIWANMTVQSITPYAKEVGMSSREIGEFIDKLTLPTVPDFDLDITMAKEPEFFADKITENS